MVTIKDAEKIIAIKEAKDAEKAQRMEVANRIMSLIDEKGDAGKTKDGKTKYHKYLVETEGLGINKGTATGYLKGDIPLSWNHIKLLADYFGCCVEYLTLQSDAKQYKLDEVIKHIGLSESVVETLHARKLSAKEFGVGQTFLDTVNLLLDSDEGLALITSIMIYRNNIRCEHEAYQEHIKAHGTHPRWIQNTRYFHKDSMDSFETFSEEIDEYKFGEGELSKEQKEGLFNYLNIMNQVEDADYQQYKCNAEMVRFLDLINRTETKGISKEKKSLLKSFYKVKL